MHAARDSKGTVLGCFLLLTLLASSAVLAGGPASVTHSNVYWWWDLEQPVGTSTLIRNDSGITAVLETSGLPSGQAVTLWFIFFNRPENCDSDPCAALEVAPNELLADLFAAEVGADFHFGSGNVIGGSGRAAFGAHLAVGDVDGSGRVEIGLDTGIPLLDPANAEVLLALHSHGPKLQGTALRDQISSYLGGCQTFLGVDGFATGPADVPTDQGECGTIQFSLHPGAGD
jgi:hypothetical protein